MEEEEDFIFYIGTINILQLQCVLLESINLILLKLVIAR